MVKYHKTFYLLHGIAFLLALSTALPAYVQSSFLEGFMTLQMLSLYLTVIMALTLIMLIIYPHIINKLTNLHSQLLVTIISIVALLILGVSKQPIVILILFAIQYISLNLLFINSDIALENISDDAHTGVIRGRHLTIINIGWLISPLLMGLIISLGSYQLVYFIAGLIMILNLFVVYLKRDLLSDHKEYKVHKMVNLLKSLYHKKNLRKIFSLSFVLNFFYCLMVLYTPIYLNQNIGLEWGSISLIFTVMLLPFVLFGLPAGKIADKWLGEKEIIIAGIILMFITTGMIFFLNSNSVILWALLLFIGRTGAAIFEAMQETYFFKHVNGEDLDLINLFRDLRPMAWLIGTGLSVIILHYYPVQYIFIFLAIILFLSLYPALTIKDTK
ncbi:MFS transporter [Patescibacteria group bacterium]|nr:MFS transporter [Patescibacteria group bacterium]